MKTLLTLDVLKTMSSDELEDYRAASEDFRRELSHAVMRDHLTVRLVRECRIPVRIWRLLSCPDPFYPLSWSLMWPAVRGAESSLDSGLCYP
jgi:hypothetical protein